MIRSFIKRKDDVASSPENYAATISRVQTGAEFNLIRANTNNFTHQHQPPSSSAANGFLSPTYNPTSRSRSNSSASTRRRLSQRLHLSRDPAPSDNIPANLPAIQTHGSDAEAEWEKRATMLAMGGSSRPGSPGTPTSPIAAVGHVHGHGWAPPQSNKELDADIQEAIRLHEEGDLTNSTRIFAKLANPAGANNPLSQVLYGLALRHGWGVAEDQKLAVHNLSLAAANAASIEQRALDEGKVQGGAAKGELVLAIYELANCFRHGWGVEKDDTAAKHYYETAANLGDTDAMNEVAACYMAGLGCHKDKFAAAQYYRLAEKNGNKTIGNSWIWKDKYNLDNAPKKGFRDWLSGKS